MLDTLKKETIATWSGGSMFDRVMAGLFVAFLIFDIASAALFDAGVDIAVLLWIWWSVKENIVNG